MNAKQAENLRILADHAMKMTRPLEMGYYSQCGTPCCMWGEAATLAHFKAQGLSLDGDGLTFGHSKGRDLFGVDNANDLFGSPAANCWHGNPTPKQWAAKAREILAAHGYGPQSSEDWAKDKVAYVINSQDALIGTDKRDLLVTK